MGYKEDNEKRAHDLNADKLNKTTYRKPGTSAVVNPMDKDAPGLVSRLKARKKPTAADAANALARRKKEVE